MQEHFLSAQQASQVLGVNIDTMRRYLRQGKVRALRLGKDWKIPESALSELSNTQIKPAQNEKSMEKFLQMAEELSKTLDAQGFKGVDSAELINAARDERTARIIGDRKE